MTGDKSLPEPMLTIWGNMALLNPSEFSYNGMEIVRPTLLPVYRSFCRTGVFSAKRSGIVAFWIHRFVRRCFAFSVSPFSAYFLLICSCLFRCLCHRMTFHECLSQSVSFCVSQSISIFTHPSLRTQCNKCDNPCPGLCYRPLIN